MAEYVHITMEGQVARIAGEIEAAPVRNLPPSGNGYLAGEYPDGITKVNGIPVSAQVRVLYRPGAGKPGDGVVVASTTSAQDGTWRVNGLSPLLRYDVVGRKDGHNDTLMANITPMV